MSANRWHVLYTQHFVHRYIQFDVNHNVAQGFKYIDVCIEKGEMELREQNQLT
jgi:hypothetical protein